jgi:peptide-methionine (S)-S-oxide reductase
VTAKHLKSFEPRIIDESIIMKYLVAILTLAMLFGTVVQADDAGSVSKDPDQKAIMKPDPQGSEAIILAAGCFWCTEAIFQQIPGVISVTSGYTDGTVKNPSYEQVCTGMTGHAEANRVVFDPKKTSLEKILVVFWEAHDPTSLNQQGADAGTQYRSGIFYSTDEQRKIIEKSLAEASKEYSKPIVTEIAKATEFYPAENYHQDYYRLNKNRNPYCTMVISPKLKKLGLKQ